MTAWKKWIALIPVILQLRACIANLTKRHLYNWNKGFIVTLVFYISVRVFLSTYLYDLYDEWKTEKFVEVNSLINESINSKMYADNVIYTIQKWKYHNLQYNSFSNISNSVFTICFKFCNTLFIFILLICNLIWMKNEFLLIAE